MTGDFTRDTFRPAKGYSAVRMQQGRLFTDADWNEEGDIQRAALRGTARSVIGASGFPEQAPGFAILAGAGGQTLLIGGGQAFVDGIGVVHAAPVRLSLARQSASGAATRWRVEAGTRVAVGDYLILAGNTPAQAVRVAALLDDANGLQTFLAGAALSASNAIAADLYRSAESQPFWPESALPAAAGDYLAYLDVWERPVTAADDPAIRESAFGGPDTAIRDQIVWQLRFIATSALVAAGAASAPVTCASFAPGWSPFGPAAPGRMAARARPAAAVADPCALPATGGYRSLENHLYRIEVHNGGAAGGRWKWSRDNGGREARYAEIDNGALLLDSLGPDEPGALRKDDWVEILDEARRLKGQPGFFARLSDINGTRVSLGEVRHPETLAALTSGSAPDLSVLPAKGIVRRWEGGLPADIAPGQWAAVEQGIEVQFAAGRLATGDHWQIPARSLAATIEWPEDEATGAEALLPPKGVVHHYAALALVNRDAGGSWSVVSDCRNLFPPLTALRSFLYLGGDGQEAMPDPLAPANRIPLAAPLRVGVIRGRTPLAGLEVEYEIVDGDGRLGAVADNLRKRRATTGPDGVASIAWALDAAMPVQTVTARLLDAAGVPTHLPIYFTARLDTAAAISFDPANTPSLAGENTVQKAIEKLANQAQAGCSTYIVTEGSDWVAILKAIKDGEDASICFQRGLYETAERVEIRGKGHLSIHGAGGGTRIVANRAECALHFEGCASVTLRDLDIAAPDGSGAIGKIADRQGVVTILDTPVVDVSGLSLRCGGGAETERTGLTIRGAAERPLASVHVVRNRLAIGLAQDGILVADAVNTIIADNELAVVPGKAGLSPGRQLEAARWRKSLGLILVADPAEVEARGGPTRVLQLGTLVATFESPMPQDEWDRLFAAEPPRDDERRTIAGVQSYIKRLSDVVIADPDRSPTFSRTIRTLNTRIGDTRMAAVDAEVRRALVLIGEPAVRNERIAPERGAGERVPPDRGGAGKVTVTAGSVSVAFDSPINQADWTRAMRMAPMLVGGMNRGDAAALIRHLRQLAVRMGTDEAFRAPLPSAVAWFARFTSEMPSYARQAITCGGSLLTTVRVRGNKVYGFVRGVHVGISDRDPRIRRTGEVVIAGNHLSLRKPADEVYVPMGLFVGNADTVRIQRNTLDWAGQRTKTPFNHGIRVWGDIGAYLKISDNRIAIGRIGIAVQPARDLGNVERYLWVAADNLVEQVSPANVIKAPRFLIRRDNRPV
ncbi:MAG TPA: DUF6519 domain-containing protein [Sphingopyxis sp.]|nr:DUF6519 domain-containing protein [Sphingopyxis sp.]